MCTRYRVTCALLNWFNLLLMNWNKYRTPHYNIRSTTRSNYCLVNTIHNCATQHCSSAVAIYIHSLTLSQNQRILLIEWPNSLYYRRSSFNNRKRALYGRARDAGRLLMVGKEGSGCRVRVRVGVHACRAVTQIIYGQHILLMASLTSPWLCLFLCSLTLSLFTNPLVGQQ